MAMTIQCDFLLDTGATMMSVLPRDITEIQTLSGNLVPSLGSCRVQTAGGIVSNPSVVLQAMVFARGQPVLPSWVDVRAIVNSSSGGLGRLSGVWLFNLLFVLSMPDNHRNLFIGSDVGEMLASLPIPDYRNAIPAPIYM